MCAEKVERFCSIDCASPMSARKARKTGSTSLSAGTGTPACAIIASSPAVFSATVLPPVFGPLMISCRAAGSSPSVSGTMPPPLRCRRRSSSGCRALLDQQLRRIITGESRRSALVLLGEARPRLQRIDLGEYRGSRSERHRLAGYLARHLDEDAVHFCLLFVEQADEFVILIDRLERLDIYGLAAAAGAVHHTRDAAFELCLHRNDEALAANRDEVFLCRALAGEAAQRLAQTALDGALLTLDLAADARADRARRRHSECRPG